MADQELTIRSICSLSGVNANTLRAWERRYGAVRPKRLPSGRRLYTHADLRRVRLLSQLSRAGHSIGALASLQDSSLEKLASEVKKESKAVSVSSSDRGEQEFIRELVQALHQYDLKRCARVLGRARMALDIRSFVLRVVTPLLGEVGQLVSKQQFSVAQEHALSALLRANLGQLMQVLNDSTDISHETPSIVFAAPEGDHHEFGILLAAILAAHWGQQVFFLGANLPSKPLADAAEALDASIVVLGTSPTSASYMAKYVQELESSLTDGVQEIWIGGPLIEGFDRFDHRRVRMIGSLSEFDNILSAMSPTHFDS